MAEVLYLVTGALGHVGATVVEKLLEKECRIRGLAVEADRGLLQRSDIELIYGDVRDKNSLRDFFANPDHAELIVIHTAGIVSIASKHNQAVYDVNVTGTKNIVELCIKNSVKKLIYVSSVHAIPELEKGRTISEIQEFVEDYSYVKQQLENCFISNYGMNLIIKILFIQAGILKKA